MIQLRTARLPQDVDTIVSLYLQSATFHSDLVPGRYSVPEASALREQLQTVEASGNAHLLALAEDENGYVVGLVVASVVPVQEGLMRSAGPILSISDIVVTDTARGRGYGRQLLEAAEGWGRQQGAREVALSVDPANQVALRLYDHAGYRPVRQEMRKPLYPD